MDYMRNVKTFFIFFIPFSICVGCGLSTSIKDFNNNNNNNKASFCIY